MCDLEKKQSILIVDDDPNNLEVLDNTLSGFGYELSMTMDGKAALNSIRTQPPDLILLDIHMPDMDGFEVCRHLKSQKHSREIPVIFVSDVDDDVDKAKGFRLGAVDYITKPFEPWEVLARVKTHLTIRNMQSRLEVANRQLRETHDELERLNAELEERVDQRTAELKAANKALQESEERLRQVVEHMPIMMDALDENSNAIVWNRECERVTGYSAEEMVGNPRSLETLYPDTDYQEQMIAELVGFGFDFRDKEYTLTCKDGTEKTISWFNISDRIPIPGWYTWGIGVDVTERKQVEQALKESEGKFRSLFDNINVAVALHEIMTDENNKPVDFIFLEANPAYEELTHLNVADIIGKRGLEVIPNLEQKWIEAYGKVAQTGESMTIIEHSEYLDKYWEVKAYSPKKNQFAVAFTDITERKRTEEALRESENKFRSIVESSPMGMHMYHLESDDRLVFMGANRAADRILGVNNSQFIGKAIEEAFPPLVNTEVPDYYRRAAAQGKSWVTEQIDYKDEKIAGAYEVHAFQTEPGKMVAMFLDITDRKQAEEALRESEDHYRALFEYLPIPAFTKNHEGQYTSCNAENQRYWAVDPVGRTDDELLDHETAVELRKADLYVMENGETLTVEEQLTDTPLGERHVLSRKMPLRDGRGDIVGILGASIDITERKQAEKELKEYHDRLEELVEERTADLTKANERLRHSEERLTLAIIGTGGALWEEELASDVSFDEQFGTTYYSQEERQLLGFGEGDELSPRYEAWHHHILPEDQALVKQRQREHFEGHTDYIDHEYRVRLKDGSIHWIHGRNCIMRDDGGRPIRWIGIDWDITTRRQAEEELKKYREHLEELVEERTAELHTINEELEQEIIERRRVEEALRESEARFNAFMENLPAAVFIKDAESRTLYANHYMENIFGTQNWLGKTADELFPQKMGQAMIADDHKAFHEGHQVIIQHVPGEGGIRMYETHKFPIQRTDGSFLLGGIALDMTERVRAEEEIRTLNITLEQRVAERTAQLEATNNELKDFAYIVSHDLKAPLRNVSQLSTWLIQDYRDKLDEQGKELLHLLISRVKRMSQLIDGVLEYSRIGRIHREQQLLDLRTIVHGVIDSLAPPVHIHVTVESTLPLILGDPTRIIQLFQNVIGNAIQYNDKPQGLVTIGCEDTENLWKFSVSDNGPGIEKKDYGRIFKIFQTGHRRDEIESTGVGLTVVKKIIELYGGEVWVESEIGMGSTFFFTIPKE